MINKQTLHPEWKQLVEVTKDAPYGKSFSHEELAAIMQIDLKTNPQRYYRMIQKWKRCLLKEHRRCVEPQHTTGYRVLEPNQHTGAMRTWFNRAGRRVKKAVEIGVATPTEMLTAEENLRLGNTLAKHGSMLSMFRRVQQQTRPNLPITALADHPPKMLKKP